MAMIMAVTVAATIIDDQDWVGNDDENYGNGDDENTWKALLRCVALLIGRSDTWSMMSFNTITSWALI